MPDSAVAAINHFLRHAADRDLPDAELFDLKARAFDLMADQAAEAVDAAECRRIADGARAVAAQLAPVTVLPLDGVCVPCWMFTHVHCADRSTCLCRTCYPHRRSPSEGDGKHA